MLLLKACKYYFGNSGLRGALTMPIPDKIENKKPLVFYSVIYRKYDSLSAISTEFGHIPSECCNIPPEYLAQLYA